MNKSYTTKSNTGQAHGMQHFHSPLIRTLPQSSGSGDRLEKRTVTFSSYSMPNVVKFIFLKKHLEIIFRY